MTGWTHGDFPWKRHFHPRRGGSPGAGITLDPKAAEKIAALIGERSDLVAAVSRHPSSPAPLVEALRAHLGGAADPLGAAVAYEVLTGGGSRPAGMFVDHWVREHGLAFAAAAFGHSAASFRVEWLSYGGRAVGGGPLNGRLVPGGGRDSFGWDWNSSAVVRLRALLAAAGEADYRAAVAVLAEHRERGRDHRLVAAFLAPTEEGWVDDVLPDLALSWYDPAWLIWCGLGTEDHLAALTAAYVPEHRHHVRLPVLATLADAFGERIVPLLARMLDDDDLGSEGRKAITAVLSRIPTDEAFGILLARREQHRQFTAGLTEAMRAFPGRAVRLLDEAGASPKIRELLRGHLLGHPELLDGDLPPVAREVAGGLRRLPDAPAESLPELLVSPPWTKPRKPVKPVVLELEPAAGPTVLCWLPGERESWSARSESLERFGERPDQRALEAGQRTWTLDPYLLTGPEDDARSLLGYWEPNRHWEWTAEPIIARFGIDSLAPVRAAATASPAGAGRLLAPFADLGIARLMADWNLRLKTARPIARDWLVRHGVGLLVPDALGAPGKARTAAEAALRVVPQEDALTAARAHGPAAEQAVADLLGTPADDLPRRMPAIGSWAEPARLPQIRLLSGGALPAAAAGHVLSMLAISRPDAVYAGLGTVVPVCEPESLDAFAWAVFEAWRQAGMPAKDGWALTALGILGGDETVRRLTPVIRAWPGEGGHARAVAGLDVLAEIGTDVALMHLHGISQRLKFKALRERAREKIDEVADGLGLTAEQLADRLVPDLGLGPDGSTVLDFGSRRFTVGFDEQLRPYVLDGDGKRRKDLPAPGVKDDPELAAAARQRFSGLKKDVRAVASRQIQRLERAMVRSRTWTAAEFRELFVCHPLQSHLARRLVFLSEAGAFRVAEDRTFANVEDDPFVLPADATVRLAHPIHLGASVAAWSELFADYEILQPFPQLGRPVITLDPGETLHERLARFASAVVPTTKVLSLQYRGWERGEVSDGVSVHRYSRELPSGRHLTLDLDPGIVLGYLDEAPEQTLHAVAIVDHPHASPDTDESADAVTVSEVIVDLTALTS